MLINGAKCNNLYRVRRATFESCSNLDPFILTEQGKPFKPPVRANSGHFQIQTTVCLALTVTAMS
jgi:hypothetical protein